MSHGCSRENPATDKAGFSCGYYTLIYNDGSHIHERVNTRAVFLAGLRGEGWRWNGQLYWNGQHAGWHYCQDHWHECYYAYLFEQLRDMPSWMR